MKKVLVFIWCLATMNSLFAQEVNPADSISLTPDSLYLNNDEIPKEDVENLLLLTIDSLKQEITTFRNQYSAEVKNKPKVIRDTIIVHSDEHITSSIDSLAYELSILCKVNETTLKYAKDSFNKVRESIYTLYIILSLLILIISVSLFLIIKINNELAVYKDNSIEFHDKPDGNHDDRLIEDNILNEIKDIKEMIVTMQMPVMHNSIDLNNNDIVTEKADATIVNRPSLESYNNCVYEFIKLNDHIFSLRRRETKNLVFALYAYLATLDNNKDQVNALIRDCNLAEDEKVQFISLVDEIQNFIEHKIQIINNWLKYDSESEVKSYAESIRIPINQVFNKDLDRDIVGDDLSGQTITMVHKLGFYFPGNTIKPYREKSVVSA